MRIRAFKYLSPLTIYILAWLSFNSHGLFVWFPLLYTWVLLPVVELLLPEDSHNLSAAEEAVLKADRIYDWLLYIFVVLQLVALVVFLTTIREPGLSYWDVAGRTCTMGLLCGTFGINIGHELGHRINKWEQALAKVSLMTSLYMHFFIEHNKGHHKQVATPEDPSSARYNEPVYLFYGRTICYTYLSAWRIAAKEQQQKKLPLLHWSNAMLQVQLIQFIFVIVIVLLFGWPGLLHFLPAALMGILLLETVNYIEHYGLQRKQTAPGKYERTQPHHSWNSNHVLGRIMLFELSRHSDHHYLASRKYQLLRHHDNSPQLPTGYPGSMLLALVPPLWFYVMNRRIQAFEQSAPNGE